jgi:hypothetical protein
VEVEVEADTAVALEAVVAMEAALAEVWAATSAALPAVATPSVACMEKDLGGVMASVAVISGDSLLSATPSTMTHVGGARAIIDGSAHNEKPACAPRGASEFVRPISRARFGLSGGHGGAGLSAVLPNPLLVAGCVLPLPALPGNQR